MPGTIRNGRRNRIVCIALGTRGDVQPICVLGRALRERGYEVTIVTTSDYFDLATSFGVNVAKIDVGYDALARDPRFDGLFHRFFLDVGKKIGQLYALSKEVEGGFSQVIAACVAEIREADLVVYNPFAFFAGQIAKNLRVPSIRVMFQPLLPSWRVPVALVGRRNLGRLRNRVSYESFRVVSLLLRRSCKAGCAPGTGRGLHALTNPLTLGIGFSPQILAYSRALSPEPGDWPVSATVTGFWYDEPGPDERLPKRVADFIAAGEPPIYIGFGSMMWGSTRNTEVVMRALEIWGGRAIVARGAGGIKPMHALPPNVLMVNAVNHALLFPHMAAAVHHGGGGMTAQALKCGLPNVILPVLGDQLYWGRRVAAWGAAEAPVPLKEVTAEGLARRIATAVDNRQFRLAAQRMSTAMLNEPGVSAAVDRIGAHLVEVPAGRA